MSAVDDELAAAIAAEERRRALRPDPGTTRRTPTVRQGRVSSTFGPSPACEVDGHRATNVTGWLLDVGDKVLLLVVSGARYVVGVFDIKEEPPW